MHIFYSEEFFYVLPLLYKMCPTRAAVNCLVMDPIQNLVSALAWGLLGIAGFTTPYPFVYWWIILSFLSVWTMASITPGIMAHFLTALIIESILTESILMGGIWTVSISGGVPSVFCRLGSTSRKLKLVTTKMPQNSWRRRKGSILNTLRTHTLTALTSRHVNQTRTNKRQKHLRGIILIAIQSPLKYHVRCHSKGLERVDRGPWCLD